MEHTLRGKHRLSVRKLNTHDIDYSTNLEDNINFILTAVIEFNEKDVAKAVRLVNDLCRLSYKITHHENFIDLFKKIALCLRFGLLQTNRELRASILRAFRYLLIDSLCLDILFRYNVDHLIARSMDLSAEEAITLSSPENSERVQALRLIRHIAYLKPQNCSCALIAPIVALCVQSEKEGGSSGLGSNALLGSYGRHQNSRVDQLTRACLFVLCELAILCPQHVAKAGGLAVLLRACLDPDMPPRVVEGLVATLLHLNNNATTRSLLCGGDFFEHLVTPLTNLNFQVSAVTSTDLKASREARLNSTAVARLALLAVLRAWPGLLQLSAGGALDALVAMCFVHHESTRVDLVDFFAELFLLNCISSNSVVSDEEDILREALMLANVTTWRESWALSEGYVAEEAADLLPYRSSCRMNVIDNYIALLLHMFVHKGLLQGLCRIIVECQAERLAVRTTVLLGELFHLASTLLPAALYEPHIMQVEELLQWKSATNEDSNNCDVKGICGTGRRSCALIWLKAVHELKRQPVRPHSLILEMLLAQGTRKSTDKGNHNGVDSSSRLQSATIVALSLDAVQNQMQQLDHAADAGIAESGVLSSRCSEPSQWCWSEILSAIKMLNTCCEPERGEPAIEFRLRFLRKLCAFYSPLGNASSNVSMTSPGFNSSNLSAVRHDNNINLQTNFPRLMTSSVTAASVPIKMAAMPATWPDRRLAAEVACELTLFLARYPEHSEPAQLLAEWLCALAERLEEVVGASPDCRRGMEQPMFWPSNLERGCASDLLLAAGRLTLSERGEELLEITGVKAVLLNLCGSGSYGPSNILLVKCTLGALDYSRDGTARLLLARTCTAASEESRLYAVNFLRLLLRTQTPFFANWGVERLASLLYDPAPAVAKLACSVLEEALEEDVCRQTLLRLRPAVLHQGYRGASLMCRLLATPTGLIQLRDSGWLSEQLRVWQEQYNFDYVDKVEILLAEALTCFEHPAEGEDFSRVSCRRRFAKRQLYLPAHLYGQLARHREGIEVLEADTGPAQLFEKIRHYSTLECEVVGFETVRELKAALWGVSQLGSSMWGVHIVDRHNALYYITELARNSSVLSVRGTAFWCLCLLASSRKGADLLRTFGWETLRSNRQTLWSFTLPLEKLPLKEPRKVPFENGESIRLNLISRARGVSSADSGLISNDISLSEQRTPIASLSFNECSDYQQEQQQHKQRQSFKDEDTTSDLGEEVSSRKSTLEDESPPPPVPSLPTTMEDIRHLKCEPRRTTNEHNIKLCNRTESGFEVCLAEENKSSHDASGVAMSDSFVWRSVHRQLNTRRRSALPKLMIDCQPRSSIADVRQLQLSSSHSSSAFFNSPSLVDEQGYALLRWLVPPPASNQLSSSTDVQRTRSVSTAPVVMVKNSIRWQRSVDIDSHLQQLRVAAESTIGTEYQCLALPIEPLLMCDVTLTASSFVSVSNGDVSRDPSSDYSSRVQSRTALNVEVEEDNVNEGSRSTASAVGLERHRPALCLSCGAGGAFSYESSDELLVSNSPSAAAAAVDAKRITTRRQALALFQELLCEVGAARHETALIRLRETSNVTDDVCLYSELCLQLSSCRFNKRERLFLQELYLEQLARMPRLQIMPRLILGINHVPACNHLDNGSSSSMGNGIETILEH